MTKFALKSVQLFHFLQIGKKKKKKIGKCSIVSDMSCPRQNTFHLMQLAQPLSLALHRTFKHRAGCIVCAPVLSKPMTTLMAEHSLYSDSVLFTAFGCVPGGVFSSHYCLCI